MSAKKENKKPLSKKKSVKKKLNPAKSVNPPKTSDLDIQERVSPDEYLQKVREKQGYMPVGDHLEELRWRIIKAIASVFVFATVAFIFYEQIWQFIMGPLGPLIQKAPEHNLMVKLITLRLSDYFFLKIKISFLAGLILSAPVILFEIWKFVLPALEAALKRFGYIILFAASLLFWSGMAMARYMIWPMVIQFLIYEWLPPPVKVAMIEGVKNIYPEVHLTLNEYLGFFTGFHFGFGLAFELPIISVVLARMGVVSSRLFISGWKGAIVAIAVVSAMVTPPDIFSMIALMLPLCALYIISALLVYFVEKKKDGLYDG